MGPRRATRDTDLALVARGGQSGTATLVGQFVGSGGSARPIAKIEFTDGAFRFAIPPQWESEPGRYRVRGTARGRSHQRLDDDGERPEVDMDGHEGPFAEARQGARLGTPVTLFNGKSLDGWHTVGRSASAWSVVSGIMQNAKSGANLVTDQKFDDFKLHLEFRFPKGSNSGVYLRGRYELQIEDSTGTDPCLMLAAIYGFLPPNQNAAKKAGEWQSFDITLVGRMVTVAI